ncbi:hypothetical protein SmJEL517_g03315 [Synchytrium microbalum]|uniref:ABC transporter domain-containing protein n=1 Tax=Synchytrium microbalum TaxID=1806994 RepID=A0A507C7C6_9FUNG|nr:uncharacterized protein SmJEL517_g03315 [Synchytrium microbalum]TPX33896.1 hypothetical protein SmJEL517_g03315 [Synchytrium microbalum]
MSNWPVGEDLDEIADTVEETPLALRKSFQVRAVVRKTLSYQKRQWFTNIVCVSACPMMMILVSAMLASYLNGLLKAALDNDVLLLCSNVPSMTEDNFPYINPRDENVPILPPESAPGAKSPVKHVNFQIETTEFTSGIGLPQPCVYWFGGNYPYSEPYARKPDLAFGFSDRDTTFIPQPINGWFGTFTSAIVQYLIETQVRPWFFYDYSDEFNPQWLGKRVEADPISPFKIPSQRFRFANQSTGILDTIETRYYVEADLLNGSIPTGDDDGGGLWSRDDPGEKYKVFKAVPFFEKSKVATLDVMIADRIQKLLAELAKIDKHILFNTQPSQSEVAQYLINVSAITKDMPFGGIHFEAVDQIDSTRLFYNYTLYIGKDRRLSAAFGYPRPGFRQFVTQAEMSNAILRFSNPKLGAHSITQGVRAFPQLVETRINLPFGTVLGRLLYPFGVSFLLPIFVITLVREKEERILMMMRMNGLKMWIYYFAHYLHFYSLHTISSLVFIIAGKISGTEFFSLTSWWALLVVFFVWGFAQVACAFLLSAFFNRSRIALVLTFLIVVCGVMVSIATYQIALDGPPPGYLLWPPFAFYWLLASMNEASMSPTRTTAYTLGMIRPGDPVFTCLMYLVVESVIFLALAAYLQLVLPSEFGVQKSWKFPYDDFCKWLKRRRRRRNKGKEPLASGERSSSVTSMNAFTPTQSLIDLGNMEDESVRIERARVLNGLFDPTSPIVMAGMRKVYPATDGRVPKIAVADVTFAVEEGTCFGLLGQNGAGKTSLISILTGLRDATSGRASIAGFDISTQMKYCFRSMGICPQHDILWEDLSCKEHLMFYARLKGVPPEKEAETVLASLKKVKLESQANKLSQKLSGGERRRLSLAISLVGDPGVVFLDEPSTGLDVDAKRGLWEIIDQARSGRTIVLTTHSMEEAEVLCQRIGIMTSGILRCIGTPAELKKRYGAGFRLQFTSNAGQGMRRAKRFVESILPAGFSISESFTTSAVYEFPTEKVGVLGRIFSELEAGASSNAVLEWGISQTTLDEVFTRVTFEDQCD